MKNSILAVFLLLIIHTATAQTDRTSWLVGGNAGLDFTDQANSNSLNISLSPQAGYFVFDNLAVGMTLPFSLIIDKAEVTVDGQITSSKKRTNTVGLGPFVRYYFGQSAIRPFVEAGANYRITSAKTKTAAIETSSNESSYSLSGSAGLAYFISSNVGLETKLGYTYFRGDNLNKYSTLGLTVGFQVYLPGKD